MQMQNFEPSLIRTWLFGPGMNASIHEAMARSGADALIVDLEDSTPLAYRAEARRGLAPLFAAWQHMPFVRAVRINGLETEGLEDLGVAMQAGAQVIVYPMAQTAAQMVALDQAITEWERRLQRAIGETPMLPVCETALGVLEVRTLAAASPRMRMALMGTEDLAHDLCADRSPEGVELAYARQRFVVECRAAKIEPIDAPYTFGDTDGAVREATMAKRLGYRCKSVVLPEHAASVNEVLTPSQAEVQKALAMMEAFQTARSNGEDRVWYEGLWVEVPTFKNAQRLVQRHAQFMEKTHSRTP